MERELLCACRTSPLRWAMKHTLFLPLRPDWALLLSDEKLLHTTLRDSWLTDTSTRTHPTSGLVLNCRPFIVTNWRHLALFRQHLTPRGRRNAVKPLRTPLYKDGLGAQFATPSPPSLISIPPAGATIQLLGFTRQVVPFFPMMLVELL
eukprot:3283815-Amphidinium_carterae.2